MHRSAKHSQISRWMIFILLVLVPATVQAGAFYLVTLNNGTSFSTRYEPTDADWDPNIMMLLTDQGNWIALEKSDIADVTSDVEAAGFGVRLDSATIVLSVEDFYEGTGEGEEGGGRRVPGSGQQQEQVFLEDLIPQPGFSVQQFVNPATVNNGPTGGIPIYFDPDS